MKSVPDLRPHAVLTIEHNTHVAAQMTAAEAVREYAPLFWVSPEQMAKALHDNSIWMARLVTPDLGLEIHCAADFDVLLAAIAA